MLLKFVAINSKSLEKDKDDFFCNLAACLKSFLSPPPVVVTAWILSWKDYLKLFEVLFEDHVGVPL